MPWRSFRELVRLMNKYPESALELPLLRLMAIRTFLWTVLFDAVWVAILYPGKLFIDEISETNPESSKLYWLCGVILLAYLFHLLVAYGMSCARNTFLHRLMIVLHGHSALRQMHQEVGYLKSHSQGEKRNKVSRSADKVELLVDELFYNTLPVGIRITLISCAMWLISWQLGVVAVVTMIAFAMVTWLTDRGMQPLRESYRKQIEEIEDKDTEVTQTWRTIKLFGLEAQIVGELLDAITRLWKDELVRHAKWARYITAQLSVVSVSRAVLYAVLVLPAISGDISIGSVVLAISWMEMSYSNYNRFQELQHRMLEGNEALQNLLKLWARKPRVGEPINPYTPNS